MVVKACAVAVMAAAIGAGVSAGSMEIGKPGITPAGITRVPVSVR
jgi:hypothetical protein